MSKSLLKVIQLQKSEFKYDQVQTTNINKIFCNNVWKSSKLKPTDINKCKLDTTIVLFLQVLEDW